MAFCISVEDCGLGIAKNSDTVKLGAAIPGVKKHQM
jgi:hypothetical protein